MVEQTNREIELEKIDSSIEAIREDIAAVQRQKELGKRLADLQETENWKFVIEESFINQEVDAVIGHLSGSEDLPTDIIDGLNKALATIRGFKMFIKLSKEDASKADAVIDRLNKTIESELVYRKAVQTGEIDLGIQNNG